MLIPIASGDYRATINTFGGGIHALTYRGESLVETYQGTPPMCSGVVLVPWPNRIADAHFNWHGHPITLPVNEPERNNAIHGFFHETDWEVDAAGSGDRVVLRATMREPWPLDIAASYRLSDDGLAITYSGSFPDGDAQDSWPEGVPFAVGLHTYLNARGIDSADAVLVTPATVNHVLDERCLPTGETRPGFNGGQPGQTPVAGLEQDHCYSLPPRSRVQLLAPAAAPAAVPATVPATAPAAAPAAEGAELELGEGFDWLQVFTTTEYPLGEGTRRKAIAIEPMTARPNALGLGVDVASVKPGESVSYSLTIRAV